MRRLFAGIALVAVTIFCAPSSFAARTVDRPSERPSIAKILKKLIRILGDELVDPKP
jgi:hypothetical protein